MKRFLQFLVIFLCFQAVGVFFLWLGGFNFDQRNFWIAWFGLIWSMVTGMLSTVIVATQLE